MNRLRPIMKAVVSAVIAAATTAAPLADDGMLVSDWLWTLVAFLTAGFATWLVPNKPAAGMTQADVDGQSIVDDGKPRTLYRSDPELWTRAHYETRND